MNPRIIAAAMAAAGVSEMLWPGFNGMFGASEVTAGDTRTMVTVLFVGAAICLCIKRD
jgi:hypothetical protein|tara:strand:+ start:9737 stop:9910 length:174 start_codon:yes stop_codon:yes gene_type:complete